MYATEVLGVREVLAQAGSGELTGEALADIASAVYSADSGPSELKEILSGWDAFTKNFESATVANVLAGYARYLLGDLTGAEEILRKEKRNEWGFYLLIKATLGLGRL